MKFNFKKLKNIIRAEVQNPFLLSEYQRMNARRLEHLASLNLNLSRRSVLELGAGIGDLSSFFIDRECDVTITEAREFNLKQLRKRYPNNAVHKLDADYDAYPHEHDITFAYGLLYHLKNPENLIKLMGEATREIALIETCVSTSEEVKKNPIKEPARNITQAVSGMGCRPTRSWIEYELKKYFPHVYYPTYQPYHEQFPKSFTHASENKLTRAIFVASKLKINSDQLTIDRPDQYA